LLAHASCRICLKALCLVYVRSVSHVESSLVLMSDNLQDELTDKNAKKNLILRAIIAYGVPFYLAVQDLWTGDLHWFEVAPGQAIATHGLTGCVSLHVVRAVLVRPAPPVH
jgi:hypothetical protein